MMGNAIRQQWCVRLEQKWGAVEIISSLIVSISVTSKITGPNGPSHGVIANGIFIATLLGTLSALFNVYN